MRNNQDRLGIEAEKVDPKQDSTEELLSGVTENKSVGPLSFIVPTEFVDLPSEGKYYAVGHPLKDKKFIEIKQMTAKEEDILNSRSLAKKGVVLDRLLESLVVDKSINVSDLLSGDRQAMLLAARISAYGSDYETSVICPSCEKKQKHVFDLSEKQPTEESIEEQEVPLDVTVTERGTVAFKLPQTQWNIELMALRGQDEKTLLGLLETKKKDVKVQSDTYLVDQLKLMIISIDGHTDKKVIGDAVSVMPAKDSRYLRRTYNQALPTIDLSHKFECNACQYEANMEVPIGVEFFWPK